MVTRRSIGAVVAGSIVATVAVATSVPVAQAAAVCTHTWVGPAVGQWETPGSWSPANVPDAGDVACIPAGKTAFIDANTLGADATVDAVLGAGAIEVRKGGKLYVEGNPATEPSSIARLDLIGGTLGGSGQVTITGSMRFMNAGEPQGTAAQTTRSLSVIPPAGGATGAPPRKGRTIIAPGATMTIADDNATSTAPCQPGGNGVGIRDGRVIVNRGTTVIEACAYVAADWGTSFTNEGTVELYGSLGWYEGFLKSDLGWPTVPPLFTNKGTVNVHRPPNGDAFLISGRYSSTGVVNIDPDAGLAVETATGQGTGARLRRAASLTGASCNGANAVCLIPEATSSDKEVYTLGNAVGPTTAVAAATLKEAAGVVTLPYAPIAGTLKWGELGRRLTATINGNASGTNPYSAVVDVDTSALGTVQNNQFGAGWVDGGVRKVMPNCTANVSGPCVSSVTRLGSGDVRIVVKTTRKAFTIVPLGAKIYR